MHSLIEAIVPSYVYGGRVNGSAMVYAGMYIQRGLACVCRLTYVRECAPFNHTTSMRFYDYYILSSLGCVCAGSAGGRGAVRPVWLLRRGAGGRSHDSLRCHQDAADARYVQGNLHMFEHVEPGGK